MARDRKRAKQRRDRQARHGATAAGRPARPSPTAKPDAAASTDAPDPLEHASAEVDLAEAQLALGRPELADAADLDLEPPPDLEPEPELEPEPIVSAADPDEIDFDFDAGEPEEGTRVPARRRGAKESEEESVPAVREEGAGLLARASAFLQGSWRELRKVQWPNRREVLQATAVVLGFVVVAGLYLGVLDVLWQKVIDVLI